jgi:hypothetical protein
MTDDKWERVNTEHGRRATEPTAYTDRLKVPGGWLYRCIVKTVKAQNQYGEEISLCFVPDPVEVSDELA